MRIDLESSIRPGSLPASLSSLDLVGLPDSFFRDAQGRLALRPEPQQPPPTIDLARPQIAADAAAQPLAGAPGAVPASRWKPAILASIALHLAAAAFFLTASDDAVKLAGGQMMEVAAMGNSTDDQTAAGEAVDVTIMEIAMAEARPVAAEALQAATAETATPVETAAQPALPQTQRALDVTPDQARPVVEAERARAAETERVESSASMPPDPAPDLLRSETVAAVDDKRAVARPVETQAHASVEEPNVATRPIEAASAVPVQTAQAVPVVPDMASTEAEAAPAPQAQTPPVALPAEPPERVTKVRPEPKTPEPARTEARKPESRKAEKSAEPKAPPRTEPEARETARAASGASGNNRINARRGQADGSAQGRANASAGGGRSREAGNAATSNYPGQVVSKLRRALRGISRAAIRAASRDAHVSFTVARNGSVSAVSLARSSGSTALDEAALAAVRRAAPFPPIPEEAGRSSWQFTLPLGAI